MARRCRTSWPAAADTLVIEVPVQRMLEVGGGVLEAIELLDRTEAETYGTVFSSQQLNE